VAEIRRDDGVDTTREFEIEARLNRQTRGLVVAAARFASMKWVTEQLGARAVIAAGMAVNPSIHDLSHVEKAANSAFKVGNAWRFNLESIDRWCSDAERQGPVAHTS
jgi:hypothetical protein